MWNQEHGELRAGIKQQTFLRYRFFDPVYWEHKETLPADGPGKFLWGCHNVWLQYQYSQDSEILSPLRDMLIGGVNSILATMEKDEAGRLNLPNGRSWESKEGRNATCILAILNWSLETLCLIEEKLDLTGTDKDWSAIRATIAAYPEDPEIGYLLAENEAPVSHRHWSHLLHIYPLHMVNWDQEENREKIRKSIDVWAELSAGLGEGPPRSGYAPIGAMTLYSSIGDSSRTLRCIEKLLCSEHSYWKKTRPSIWASTMYREFGPVLETPLFFATALQDTFLQSWGGTIRVFPAVPEEWSDLIFHNMRAEGGFLISAEREAGKTQWIQITSLSGKPCRLKTDMPLNFDRLPNGAYEIPITKGETLLLRAPGTSSKITVKPLVDKRQTGPANAFGLNERFLAPRPYFKHYFDPETGK
jgi:alpha-L-fucosidase 2